METPIWRYESTLDVYEPAEDSFLLLDALESDLQHIKDAKPKVLLEIGSGSGIIITALSKALNKSAYCIAVDISKNAVLMTKETASINFAQVDIIQGDLGVCLKENMVDLLVFNPPYVVTPDEEIAGTLQRSWAGGKKGRVVVDRLFNQVENLLGPKSLFYLVVIEENLPEEIIEIMKLKGFSGKQIAFRKVRGEKLSVIKFCKDL